MKRQKIKLVFNEKPKPKQSFRIGKNKRGETIGFTPNGIKIYQKNLLIEALSQIPRGFTPMAGAIYASVVYKFPIVSTLPAEAVRKIKAGEKVLKITRPDVTDNLQKPLFDALSKKFYRDDAQIAMVNAEKVYSTKAGIELYLEEIHQY